MAGSGQRLAVRASLAALASTLMLFGSLAGVQAASPVTMAVHIGYHNAVKQGQWVPVVVDITNNGPNIEGTPETQSGNQLAPGGPPAGIAVYHAPLSLAAGATKHIRTYVLQDQFSGSITTRVVDHGRVIESQNTSATNTTGVLVGVLSD